MAACKSWGQKAGIGKDLCPTCRGKQEAERPVPVSHPHYAPPMLQEGRSFGSTLVKVGLGVAGGLLIADAVGDMTSAGGVGGGMDFRGFAF